jgi:hypothetical protein
MYQREIRTDRAGLYSERVAADAELRIGRFGAMSAEVEADLAAAEVNQARLRVQHPVWRGVVLSAEARRYRPFFEMWTIWGAFAPVGFSEGNVGALWDGAGERLSIQLRGGWRRYDETTAGVSFLRLREDGWRVGGDATWRAHERWTVHGGYRAEIGFGAARTDGDVGLRWERAGMRSSVCGERRSRTCTSSGSGRGVCSARGSTRESACTPTRGWWARRRSTATVAPRGLRWPTGARPGHRCGWSGRWAATPARAR